VPSEKHKTLREHPRVPLSVEVSLESEHNFWAGITNNISEGGIFVVTDHPPPRGTHVTFDLVIGEGGERFHIEGEVCWVRDERMASEGSPAGCGIRWVKISDEALRVIHRFVESRDTLFYEE
jgi:uncharacterized protein (TIGR02266 family)